MHAAFDGEGLARADDQAIRRIVGLPLLTAIRLLAPGVDDVVLGRLRDGYSAAWQVMRQNGELDESLYPGTKEVIQSLSSSGWVLGVATGKSHRGLVGTLENHNVLSHFATLQTADRARGKPDPEMLEKAMIETGAVIETTVMIGDTTFDMDMARNAGVMAIGVQWGYHETEELERAGAVRVIGDFSELPGLLNDIRED